MRTLSVQRGDAMTRRTLVAALQYFACVFGAGFALGVIRVSLLVPHLGARWAELLEMPFMAAVVVAAARWIVYRHALPARAGVRLGVGVAALALLMTAEVGLAILLQGASLRDVVANRDPVSGTAYALMLVAFALMPMCVARQPPPRTGHA